MVEGASGLCMPALLLFFDLDEGLMTAMTSSFGGLTEYLTNRVGGDVPKTGKKIMV